MPHPHPVHNTNSPQLPQKRLITQEDYKWTTGRNMRIFNWALLVAGVFATWTAATSKASNAGDLVLTNDGFVPRAGRADVFHRMLDPAPGTCCGMCSVLTPNEIVVILLFGSSKANNVGLLDPLLLVDIRITIIVRMTITYTDHTIADNTPLVEVFDVTVNPEDWNDEPCSYTGSTCITFENDDIRLIAPPDVGGSSVLSIPNVTAFTADSNVTVVNGACDLRCADPDVCDSIVANSTELSLTTFSPGDLEPSSTGISFAISSTAQFISGFCTTQNCPRGVQVCRDPHLIGLQGQHIVWFGVDTRWYALFKDDVGDLHINIRITSPESDFPGHQYITGMAVILGGHSIVIEVKDPYSPLTDGCPNDIAPCLADGGIRIIVDGHENDALLSPTRSEYMADGIELSGTNLPPVCQEFGHKEVLASLEKGTVDGGRRLQALTFEDWILSLANMVVPALCSEMVAEHGLLDVQSQQSILRIATPTADIRLSVGINHRNKRRTKNGRQLSELDMWQMSVGVNGLALTHEGISGLLGETSRMVYDNDGQPVMEGIGALRGTVEDYHVSDALGTDFALLHKDIN